MLTNEDEWDFPPMDPVEEAAIAAHQAMLDDPNFVPPGYCKEAWSYERSVCDDPMTQHYGMGGEIMELWEGKHARDCKICAERIYMARTP